MIMDILITGIVVVFFLIFVFVSILLSYSHGKRDEKTESDNIKFKILNEKENFLKKNAVEHAENIARRRLAVLEYMRSFNNKRKTCLGKDEDPKSLPRI